MNAARDRRGMYGSTSSRGKVDVESLEKENDSGIDALSERIGLLKQATFNIRDEAESQHTVLDRMTDSMFSTGGMLGNAAGKFKVVMADKQNRKLLVAVVAIVGVVLLVLTWLRK